MNPFLNFVRALRGAGSGRGAGAGALARLKLRAARLWRLMGEDERQPYVDQADRARNDRDDQRDKLSKKGSGSGSGSPRLGPTGEKARHRRRGTRRKRGRGGPREGKWLL